MPQTAQDWFKANAPKKPAAASAQDWAASNAPETVEPRQPTAPEQQISEQFRNAPMRKSVLRSPWSMLTEPIGGFFKQPVGVWQGGKQKDIEMGGQGNPIMGAPEFLLDVIAQGEAESQRRAKERWRAGDIGGAASQSIPLIPAAVRYGAELLERAKEEPFEVAGEVGFLAAAPKIGRIAKAAVGAELPTPAEGLRDYARRTVRAGPAQVERAAGAVGEETAGVRARNVKAQTAAELRNQGAFSEAQRAYNEARTQWQQQTTEGQAAYQKAQAEHTAAETQRGTLRTQAAQQSERLVEGLRESAKNVEAKAKALYPKIEGEVADTGVLADSIRSAAEKQMREAGPIPAEVERIVRQYTPKEAEGPLMVDGEVVEPGSELAGKLKTQGAPGFEEAGAGEPAARATFENLHSQYSALGRLARQADAAGNGYRAAAYQAARGVIRDAMETLADDAGMAEQFQAAQKEWGRMEKTFYEKGSPIAKALAKIDDIYNSLRDDPAGARQAAAPYVRQILSEAKAAGYSRKLLAQFEGAPTEMLEGMLDALEQAKKVPKTKAPKPFVPEPEPRYEPPVPAHTAELKPPPAPFSKQKFVKGQVQQTAEDLQATRGATALYKHPIGRVLERPGVQEWIAKEPPEPFGQPGQAGAQGAATPFNQPPPPPPSSPTTGPSSPVSGPGPSTPPPPAGFRGFSPETDVDLARTVERMDLRRQIQNLGDRMPAERARLQSRLEELEGRKVERRATPGQSPTGTERRSLGRRVADRVRAATRSTADVQEELIALQTGKHAQYRLKQLGIKHQPLTPDMQVELESIFKERTDISKAEARLIETALNMWARRPHEYFDTITKLRENLNLPEKGP